MTRESVWTAGAKDFMSVVHLSQERALHPAVLARIGTIPGRRMLDYGCGDGRILRRVPAEWSIDAYDPSDEMRALAAPLVGDRISVLARSSHELKGPYDLVLLGMVILTIPTDGEVELVLRDCARLMTARATLLITTTHPCFRWARFSNVSTSFSDGAPFRYMDIGAPFRVTIRDPQPPDIEFIDYHWPLSATSAALRRAGLRIRELIEVPDDPDSPDRNELLPPYLILECELS